MNRWLVLLLLVLVGNGAFHVGDYHARREITQYCQRDLFVVAGRVYLCEERRATRAQLEDEKKRVDRLERGP
jgi:hypothetical protein